MLHPNPTGGGSRLGEGEERRSVLQKIGKGGRDLRVRLWLGFTPLQQVGSRSSRGVRTRGEDLGNGCGRCGGGQGRGMRDGYCSFGLGVRR